METKKILFGGITGGIAYFFLGWLIYGILLNNFTMTNYNQAAARPMEEMIWWSMILANFAAGFLLSVIFNWSNTNGLLSGAKIGGIIGFILAISMDFSIYSMSTTFLNLTAVFVDIIAYGLMTAIAGALVAWVMGLLKEKA
ncbi:MAG: hypothetical protein ACOYO1_18065 [Bacteroidales bacterium]